MKRSWFARIGLPALVLSALAIAFGAPGAARAAGGGGLLYTMSNSASGNRVLAYTRASDGTLQPNGTYATGGTGTGQPRFGSQGSVILTPGNKWLLVANPGMRSTSAR